MTRRYALVATAIVVVLTGLAFPWLDGPGRAGLLVAAAVALPVQLLAFALLVRFASRPAGALKVWIATSVVRMAIVILVGVTLLRVQSISPVTTLLGCAGFFFVLLILEAVLLEMGGAPERGGESPRRTGKAVRIVEAP